MQKPSYDEKRMLELITGYEQLLAGLRAWVAEGRSLNEIEDTTNAPALFRLHRVAKQLFTFETLFTPAPDGSAEDATKDANAILAAAGIPLEIRQDEFVVLAAIMRTKAFRPLAPYNPYVEGETETDKIW